MYLAEAFVQSDFQIRANQYSKYSTKKEINNSGVSEMKRLMVKKEQEYRWRSGLYEEVLLQKAS